jgi:hypothetical protein
MRPHQQLNTDLIQNYIPLYRIIIITTAAWLLVQRKSTPYEVGWGGTNGCDKMNNGRIPSAAILAWLWIA